jgi:methionyl-tRNA synthetase
VPRRFYVTTPIYYPNDRPHLGTAYSTVTADALARWHRLAGDDVLSVTGTDEHGLKIVRRAEEQGMSPEAWTDETAGWFRDAWRALEVTNDQFIRTTEKRHVAAVQRFLQAIQDNGYIYKGEYAGWYCVACEAYYAEDELDPGHRCKVHGGAVEWLVEDNYFFRLSAFADRLLEWYDARPGVVVPESKRNEAVSFIRQGLADISITRTSVDWGVPVPWDPSHVVYVWYDALVNYVTAAGYGVDDEAFARWWPAVHHVVGKDILRFHCVWWPAMCMAAGIDPPHQVVVHGFLLVGGEKMSKSKLNQIEPVALARDVGVDALRYHLLREVVLGSDGDFTYESLVARYNSDLANNLGNLAQRVATVVGSKCGGIGPAPRSAGQGSRLAPCAAGVVADARAAWERFAPHDALAATWRLVRETNAEHEATEPRKMAADPAVEAVLGDALEALRIVTILASPAVPLAAAEIWRRLGLPGRPDDPGRADEESGDLGWGGYPGGLTVTKGDPVFPRRRLAPAEPGQPA